MQGVRGSSPRSSTNRDETADPSPLAGAAGGDLSPRDHVTETDRNTTRPPTASRRERGSSATTRPRSSRAGRRAGPSSSCIETDLYDTERRKFYLLTMYPYPSGDLHIGHWYIITPTDAIARFRRMHGYNVFLPIGFDAFGLPAENAAIKNGDQPARLDDVEHREHAPPAADDGRDVRLGGGGRHRRSRLLPLEPVVVPALPEGGPRLPRDVAGRLVPQRRDPGPGAGRGRRPPLLALRREGREARPGPVVLQGHQVRRRASRLQRPRLAGTDQDSSRRTGSGAAEGAEIVFDTAPDRSPAGRRPSCGCSRPARTRCSGRRSWSSPPSIRSCRS